MANKQLTHTGAELDAAISAVQNYYADIRGTTAGVADVRAGKKFVKANRVLGTGTMPDSVLTAEAQISGSGVFSDTPSQYGITIVPKAKIDQAGYVGSSVEGEPIVRYIRTEKVTLTQNVVYRPSAWTLIEEVDVQVFLAQLNNPTLSVNGSDLTITDGNNGTFCQYYDIYVDGSVVSSARVTKTSSSTTYSLTNISMSTGTHTLTVKAGGQGMKDSEGVDFTYLATSQLATPSIYMVSGTATLAINPVPNATWYELHADGANFHEWAVLSSTTYDVGYWLQDKLDTYELTVYAQSNGDYTKSNVSNVIVWSNGTKLPTPSISRDGTDLTIHTNDTVHTEKFAVYANGIFKQFVKATSDGKWDIMTSWTNIDTSACSVEYSTDGGSTWETISTTSGASVDYGTRVRFRVQVTDDTYSVSVTSSDGSMGFVQTGIGITNTGDYLINGDISLVFRGIRWA